VIYERVVGLWPLVNRDPASDQSAGRPTDGAQTDPEASPSVFFVGSVAPF